MRFILFGVLFTIFVLAKGQTTTTLQNIDWKLISMLNTQTNQNKIISSDYLSTLRFNLDSSYKGRPYWNTCGGHYFIHGNDLRMDGMNGSIEGPICTMVGTIGEAGKLEQLIIESWIQARKFSINADTLIIYCKNNQNLYYIKKK